MTVYSESVTLFLLCTVIMMCAKIIMSFSKRNIYKFPPGPTPLPIIGNLHIMDLYRPDYTFMELAKKYGTFFTFHFGPVKAVVLVGYEANKEALVKSNYDFGERGVIRITEDFQHNHGVFFSTGEGWKMTRRFTLSILRDLGMGKSPIEGRIIEELQYLNEFIKSHNGQPFEKKVLYSGPPNITFWILFGRRFDYDNPTFQKMVTIIDDLVVLTGSPPIKFYNVFGILKYFLKAPHTVVKKIEQLNEILRVLYKEAREAKCDESFRTYGEAFIHKAEREKITDEKEKIFTEENLLACTFDLMLGGTETTATTLQWGILLMMKYPNIQKRVQDEIKNVIGLDRPPRWEDQKILPYCLAVAHEIQRFGNIIPFLPHATPTDVYFRGYFIPKSCSLLSVLSPNSYCGL
ncbi:cytochrome P450 2W1-like isoform X2 [Pseudophryne corroboree]|uniref:cytochrome P450 2W1-like isoform X2 n=1 Tax=Pseudophryne corroboree TaxID=495146 RepID=UPI003081A793